MFSLLICKQPLAAHSIYTPARRRENLSVSFAKKKVKGRLHLFFIFISSVSQAGTQYWDQWLEFQGHLVKMILHFSRSRQQNPPVCLGGGIGFGCETVMPVLRPINVSVYSIGTCIALKQPVSPKRDQGISQTEEVNPLHFHIKFYHTIPSIWIWHVSVSKNGVRK